MRTVTLHPTPEPEYTPGKVHLPFCSPSALARIVEGRQCFEDNALSGATPSRSIAWPNAVAIPSFAPLTLSCCSKGIIPAAEKIGFQRRLRSAMTEDAIPRQFAMLIHLFRGSDLRREVRHDVTNLRATHEGPMRFRSHDRPVRLEVEQPAWSVILDACDRERNNAGNGISPDDYVILLTSKRNEKDLFSAPDPGGRKVAFFHADDWENHVGDGSMEFALAYQVIECMLLAVTFKSFGEDAEPSMTRKEWQQLTELNGLGRHSSYDLPNPVGTNDVPKTEPKK